MKSKPHSAGNRSDALLLPPQVSARALSLCSTDKARSCLAFPEASRLGVLPLGLLGSGGSEILYCAVSRGEAAQVWQSVRFVSGRAVKLVEVDSAVLEAALFEAYHRQPHSVEKALTDLQKADAEEQADKALQPDEFAWVGDFRSGRGDVARFLSALMDYAIARRASDLHIVPLCDGAHLRIRVAGEIQSHAESICSLEKHRQIVTRIKALSGLDAACRTKPQDGAFTTQAGARTISIRVSIMPTVHGEKLALRINSHAAIPELDALGLDPRTREALRVFTRAGEGMVLFAGPTGSGKTTTMYAVMRELAQSNLMLVSIEDPVEVQLPFIAQTGIDERSGLSFAACLKSMVRQDPDAILLGEMRDTDSARAAFQAAMTGHLLLSTVHARSAYEVLMRVSGFGIDALTIAQALSLIVCQRLLPCLCPRCKVFDLQGSQQTGFDIYQPAGCRECDFTGFGGLVLAVESLSLDAALSQELMGGRLQRSELVRRCSSSNYTAFKHTLEELLQRGSISIVQYQEAVSLL